MSEPDEFHGHGGAYVIDPETGRRVLERPPTQPRRPVIAPSDSTAEPDTGATGAQE